MPPRRSRATGRGAARLAVHRLSRCHPWGGSGYDPVPRPGAEPPRPAAAYGTAQPPARDRGFGRDPGRVPVLFVEVHRSRRPSPSRRRKPPRQRRRRRTRRARHRCDRRRPPRAGAPAPQQAAQTREAAIAGQPRVKIDTPTPARLDRAHRRPHRRSDAGDLSRHGRSRRAPKSCCCSRPAPRIRISPNSAGSPAPPAPSFRARTRYGPPRAGR